MPCCVRIVVSLYQEQHEINDSRVCRVYISKKNTCSHMYTAIPTTVLYNIYCPKSDGSVILLGWSSVNARPLRSVSRATIVLPCMAKTDKSESLSVVIVDLSQVWSLRRQENDLLLPKGTTARIFSSSTEATEATDSSGIAACLFQ